jgi:hypothetical protein
MDAKQDDTPDVTPDPKTQSADPEGDASRVDDAKSGGSDRGVGGPAAAIGTGVEDGLTEDDSGEDAGTGATPSIGAERDDPGR